MDSIEYYNKYAAKIYEDTVDMDVTDLMHQFLKELEEGDTILDLGCGSGRDSLIMYDMGYDVTPLDASEEMCKLAEIHTGLDVLQMTYEDMEFEDVFDGIWACNSLIHVPKNEMPEILCRICDALCSRGVLYLSVEKGDFEGFRGERYFCDYTMESLTAMVERTGLFEIIKTWETEDVRASHPDTMWVNMLARKR
ncbi:MAG: methyltransferase domain-containing protein [Hungatella sp.]|nr:methyltransferase domain-containing protein [Hungatella sp.]